MKKIFTLIFLLFFMNSIFAALPNSNIITPIKESDTQTQEMNFPPAPVIVGGYCRTMHCTNDEEIKAFYDENLACVSGKQCGAQLHSFEIQNLNWQIDSIDEPKEISFNFTIKNAGDIAGKLDQIQILNYGEDTGEVCIYSIGYNCPVPPKMNFQEIKGNCKDRILQPNESCVEGGRIYDSVVYLNKTYLFSVFAGQNNDLEPGSDIWMTSWDYPSAYLGVTLDLNQKEGTIIPQKKELMLCGSDFCEWNNKCVLKSAEGTEKYCTEPQEANVETDTQIPADNGQNNNNTGNTNNQNAGIANLFEGFWESIINFFKSLFKF